MADLTRPGLLLALAALGCAEGPVHFSWPPLSADTRAIAVGVRSTRGFQVFAHDYAPERALSFGDGATAVTLFAYAQSLDELGLSPGLVTPAEPEVCWARPLRLGATIYERSLEEEAWTEPLALTGPAARFAAAARCPCPSFEETSGLTLEVPLSGRPRLLRAGSRLVVASSFGSVLWPESEVSPATAELPRPNPVPGAFSDAFVAPDGSIWLSAARGVSRWVPDTGEVTTSTTFGEQTFGIDGGEVDGEPEVYLSANRGRLQRLVRGVWRDLEYEPVRVSPDSDQIGQALWLGPGEALLAPHDSRGLVLVRPDGPPLSFTRGTFLAISTLFQDADGRLLLGSHAGGVGVLREQEVHELPRAGAPPPPGGEVRRFFQVGSRVGFALEFNALGELHPEAGVCPPQPVQGFERIFDAVGDELGTWVLGREAGGERLRLARYDRRLD